MNVLMIASGQDTGGQGIRIVEAFRRHAPDIRVRSFAKTGNYIAYPSDLPFRRKSMDEQYQRADVVMVRNSFADYDRLAALHGHKPVLILFHGTAYRSSPEFWIAEAKKRDATVLVSTLDLWLLNPNESVWLPSIQNVDALEAMR